MRSKERVNLAEICLKKGLELYPSSIVLKEDLGTAWSKQGKFNEVLLLFEESVKKQPN